MKKIILVALTMIFSGATFGQQVNPSPVLAKDDYLQKSKKQKKTGTLLLAGGAALVLTGVLIPKGDEKGTSYTYGIVPTTDYENDGIKAALGLTGIAAMLGSIPFFISSGKNKRRAINLSAKNEMIRQLQGTSFAYQAVPSLSLKLSL